MAKKFDLIVIGTDMAAGDLFDVPHDAKTGGLI
jgi:hypothetical protein